MLDKTYIDNDKERAIVEIANGKKQPETDFEKQIAKEIKEIKSKGGIVEIPHDL